MSAVYAKTDRGRSALGERRALSPRERQVLILADGQRSRSQITELMQGDVDAAIAVLLQQGHLMRVSPMLRQVADFSDTGTIEFTLTRPPEPPSAAPPAAAAPVRARRSLAASKMYAIGILQLMRDPEAASLAVSLHSSADAGELTHWLVATLTFIQHRSGDAYATRVAERLLETFPEDGLPRLQEAMVATGLPALGVLAL